MATAPPPEPSFGKSLLSEIEATAPPPLPAHVYEHRYEVRLRGQTYAEVVEDHPPREVVLRRPLYEAWGGRGLLPFDDGSLIDPAEIVLFREVTPEEALDIQEEAEKAEAVFDGVEALRRALEALPPRQAATAAVTSANNLSTSCQQAAPATPANGSGL